MCSLILGDEIETNSNVRYGSVQVQISSPNNLLNQKKKEEQKVRICLFCWYDDAAVNKVTQTELKKLSYNGYNIK